MLVTSVFLFIWDGLISIHQPLAEMTNLPNDCSSPDSCLCSGQMPDYQNSTILKHLPIFPLLACGLLTQIPVLECCFSSQGKDLTSQDVRPCHWLEGDLSVA